MDQGIPTRTRAASGSRRRRSIRVGSSDQRNPQGSVLGPIIFLIYVNEILNLLQSRAKMFADDIKIYI